MRRTARRAGKALGACAAAALLALATPAGAAQAAAGALIIDGTEHEDPSGCYRLGDFAPPKVANLTDETAWVWSGTDCDGQVTQQIDPGVTTTGHGRSLFIE
ncbi:hypothetical protein BX286_3850 [Streptomyces sp. 3211.6]|uniref:hypothetical protein n=1 Tax=Streptomyces TaxID=1883 RepID=UPI0009A4763B|nr:MULTISPECIES: hypothetical protein [Streptomyces]RKT05839.1 hypothetical protein BX286_3850 [Streptomyces sp. 3211.6]RPF41776.1 hypothetical protein EDD96_5590 [Streptomyces sp. Ag109_G2-6]